MLEFVAALPPRIGCGSTAPDSSFPLCRACQVQHWQKHKPACNLMAEVAKSVDDL